MRNCSCCDPYDNSQPIAEPYVLQSGYLHRKIAWQITMKVWAFFHIRLHLNQVGMTMMPQ